MTRRTFIMGAFACAVAQVKARGVPLVRGGLMTDTHVRPTAASFALLEKAYRMFRARGVDFILNNGDVADVYSQEAYARYRYVADRIYANAARRPLEIFTWANHDRMGNAHPGDSAPYPAAFADFRKQLGFAHDMYARFDLGGFVFLLFPQWPDWKRYEREIAAACRETPDKPVFVFDHEPPFGTVTASTRFGNVTRRRILAKYPQVVNVSGHAHSSLRDETNIWQGGFTAVGLGCLTSFDGILTGCSEAPGRNDCVVLFELYSNCAVFRRFSLSDGTEIGAGSPWTIIWPRKDEDYAPSRRAVKFSLPGFVSNARLSVEKDVSCGGLRASVPVVLNPETVALYRFEYSMPSDNGKWRVFARHERRGEYWKARPARKLIVEDLLPWPVCAAGSPVRVAVVPVDFWGRAGMALTCESRFEGRPCRCRWETLPTGLSSQGTVPFAGNAAFPLPMPIPSDLVSGSWLVVDAELDEVQDGTMLFACEVGNFWRGDRCGVPAGKSRHRYAFALSPDAAGKSYQLVMRYGRGRVRFGNVCLVSPIS